MRLLIAVFLYIGTVAPALAADPNVKQKDDAENKTLLAPAPVDWIKTYSLSPYSENWTLTVTVKEFEKDLPKVTKILEGVGAKLTLPMNQFPGGSDKTQQLTYHLSEKAGKAALKKIVKLDPKAQAKITHNGELVNPSEIGDKLGKLTEERNLHRAELSATPSLATMVDEMIQHLSMVKKIRETVETQVLLNMTVREKR